MTNEERLYEELAKVKRDGIEALTDYLKKSDFCTAPSSTRFHLSVNGGLLQHSLNVLDALRGVLTHNEDGTYSYMVAGKEVAQVSEESVIIMALMHDICKTYFYKVSKRWKKDDKQNWVQYDTYEIDDKMPLGHGEKSVFILEQYIHLTPDERYAIRWHMGFTDDTAKTTLGTAVAAKPIIWALHTADMMASCMMEDQSGNKPAYNKNKK